MSEQPTKTHRNGVSRRAYHGVMAMLALTILCSPVRAERADRDKPINLEADKVTVDDKKQTSTFEGAVVLTQGTIRITADRIVVRQNKDGIQNATAYGKPATFKTKRDGLDEYVEGFADQADYDGRTEKLELTHNAILKRGQDEVRGNYITYEVSSEFMQVFGNAPSTAAGSSKPGGRVTAVIQPKPKKDGAAQPPTVKQ